MTAKMPPPPSRPTSGAWGAVQALLLLVPLLGQGCGGKGLSYTVDESKLKEMSRNGQLWIYDAENEIVVALDKLDEAKDTLAQIQRSLDAAEQKIEGAQKRNTPGAVEMAEVWQTYMEKMQEWAEENIELCELGVLVARSTVELAKAQVINREDLLGGKGFSITDYKNQYNRLKEEHGRKSDDVGQIRKQARALERKWWDARRRFVARTGDHNTGLWID